MDPHDLAIAALDAVVAPSEGTAAGRDAAEPGNVALERSRGDDATAGGMRPELLSSEMVEGRELPANSSDGALHPLVEGEGTRNKAIVGKEPPTTTEVLATSLQSTSSLNSQSTDLQDGTSASPTSEGFSSQSTNPDGPLSQLSQLAAAQAPLLSTNPGARPLAVVTTTTTTAGQKRTADGQVKTPVSPREVPFRRHSRTISNTSSIGSNRLGELSSELRTRLSYAMVKVNNGWTSNSIDEVETLASQAGSPTSSTSTLHGRRNLTTSPRVNIASYQSRPGSNTTLNRDFDLYSRSAPSSRTYESFWRDHSSSSASYYRQSPQGVPISSPRSKVSLGPPADIHPSNHPRRTDAAGFSKPPNLPGQSASDMSHYSQKSFNSPTPTPHTPIRRGSHSNSNRFQDRPAGIRTPTQKTIQEQDAIETLLFMSSPGNSGNMSHAFPPPSRSQASPQRSPLRTEFSPHIKSVSLDMRPRQAVNARPEASTTNGVSGGPYNAARAKMNSMSKDDRAREQAIDQLLDEMGDSSSDEELTVDYSTSRRVPAGKV